MTTSHPDRPPAADPVRRRTVLTAIATAFFEPTSTTSESDASASDPEPEMIARLAGAEIVDPLAALRAEDGELWVDPVHPTARGMAVIAREIAAMSGEPKPGAADAPKTPLPARFTRKSTGWK